MTNYFNEDWTKMKLPPRLTGLPMSVWVTEKDELPDHIRVKVASAHGAVGTWQEAATVSIRPTVRRLLGEIKRGDLELAAGWIIINRQLIIDFWNGKLDPDDVIARLTRAVLG